MTVKDKESALHGNSMVQDLRGWPKANTRIVKVMAKRFFQTFSCTTQCAHNKKKKKKHSDVTHLFPFTAYVGKCIQSHRQVKSSRATTSTSVFRETSPGTARQENKKKNT